MILLMLSDIHGNLTALNAVLKDVQKKYKVEGAILVGDIIDYGMRSNEVIECLKILPFPIYCNIWGNHENAIINREYGKFSSERGKCSAIYTTRTLNEQSIQYLLEQMTPDGKKEFEVEGKKIFGIHGSLEDIYWKSIAPDRKENFISYQIYDYVISGHSHRPHFFEIEIDTDQTDRRKNKKVIFINPGSVGQPRNHNNMAQYAILNLHTEQLVFEKVLYDIEAEQQQYTESVDIFYKERLKWGI